MRKLLVITTLLVIACTFTASASGKYGPKNMKQHNFQYDKDTFITVNVVVAEVYSNVYNPSMQDNGLHLTVDSEYKRFTAHVAPQWYIDKQKITFTKGDIITLSGSEFHADQGFYEGDNIFVSSFITPKYTDPVMVRDADTGTPLWRGRNSRNPQMGSGQKGMKGAMGSSQKGTMKGQQGKMQEQMQQKMKMQMQKKMMQQNMKNNMGQGNSATQ